MPWEEVDPVGHGGAAGRALVLLERDGLGRELVHGERPEQSRDGEEEDALRDVDARADATAAKRGMSMRTPLEGRRFNLPSTEGPVVALHGVALARGLGRSEIIVEVAIRIERQAGVQRSDLANNKDGGGKTHGSG